MNKQQGDLFKQGTLELLILRLLSSGSLNGWDIMQRIELLSADVLTVTAGALYPALHRLEARGLISAVWRPSDNNRRAKFYGLTRPDANSSSRSASNGSDSPMQSLWFYEMPEDFP